MININDKKTILITGASSGLGQALAYKYAKLGWRIVICGRSAERLAVTTEQCLQWTTEVYASIIDVTCRDSMTNWLNDTAKLHKLDIVVANAGISAGSAGAHEHTAQIYQIFDTNLYGVLNTILPSINIMLKQGFGQIAIISSIAGLIPLAGAPSYSASKVAIKSYGDSLRVELKAFNIKVNIVTPGFIKTAMTARNNFAMPFIVTAEQAAEHIYQGLENNYAYIFFPRTFYYLTKFAAILPRFLLDYILVKLPLKGSFTEQF